jgi:uncharacterized protein
MRRIVCDTNVVVSGLLWNGTPRQMLARVEQGHNSLFTSRTLLDELDKVLRYPRLASILCKAGLDRRDILRWLVRHATIVMPKPLGCIVVAADPSDDHALACAVSAAADVIVSGDRHLLDLRSFREIPILTASQLLHGVD